VAAFCPQCGARNADDAGRCSSCNTTLITDSDRTQALSRADIFGPDSDDGTTLGTHAAATLMVRTGPQAGDRFTLSGTPTRLGRHPDSDVSLDDISVSRRHAEIERHGVEYVLRDVGSLNGTYVNQRRVDSVVLQQGDEILVGRFRLLFIAPSESA